MKSTRGRIPLITPCSFLSRLAVMKLVILTQITADAINSWLFYVCQITGLGDQQRWPERENVKRNLQGREMERREARGIRMACPALQNDWKEVQRSRKKLAV